MTRFPTRVWATITRHAMLAEGDRVLVAVSGGADSVALLHVLATLVPRAGARLAGVVHVHHGLRGPEADADAAFCERLAADLGVPFDLVPVDVSGEARRRRWSIERTAHLLRHAAYRQAARTRMATRIALGHTLDDQAETVVLRFLRGAGTRGLSGMWPVHGLVVRPLLEVRRADVEHYVATRGLTWRDDASNRDTAIARNRVRHELLPALTSVAGASLPERLARQADAWRDDEQWLAACAAVEVPSVLTPDADGGWWLDIARLADVPPMLRRRVRLAALEQVLPRGRVTLALVNALERVERSAEGRTARLGGLDVRRQGRRLRIVAAGSGDIPRPSRKGRTHRERSASSGSGRGELVERVVAVPGTLEVEDAGICMVASVLRREAWEADAGPLAPGTWAVALDADRVGTIIRVRGRRPGDRMRPVGAPGSQKIQDLMVNRKVPRRERDRVPVVTTELGQIAWVVGLAVGEEFAVQPHTTAVLLLQATRSGGKA
ncbi:tRNA(Ile)-lysidine synthase [Luteitalea sp. TBR-22]|uniref:tRNA lysidine(34) synthetase TilS n=1 Tax=Luteitalea sp. TBR-22 TaxID=2802971 RepID=UPI001AF8AB1F|nr:tRNA lysidine(34) synthetase TilS [Luteitalea sp. TBR-22]BCS31471.1 tRNA(Ile)-lysidine synthase [Luteitalea sp. TBR-22]